MKKNILIALFLIFNINCFGNYSCQAKKAQQEYLNRLIIIERFINLNGKKSDIEGDGDLLNEAVEFMERITGIHSNSITGFEILYIPNKKNFIDWKNWYKKNKKLLYWDKTEKKVKVLNRNR